jgi:hypothetical protein
MLDLVTSTTWNNDPLKLAIMVLLDFAAAFPSLAHTFIMQVLRHYKFPAGLLNYFGKLCTNNASYSSSGGAHTFLYCILSGILLGCPSSGTIFVLCIDPFLRAMPAELFDPTVCAFADDIAALLRTIGQLEVLNKVFLVFEKLSGMALRPKKFV